MGPLLVRHSPERRFMFIIDYFCLMMLILLHFSHLLTSQSQSQSQSWASVSSGLWSCFPAECMCVSSGKEVLAAAEKGEKLVGKRRIQLLIKLYFVVCCPACLCWLAGL